MLTIKQIAASGESLYQADEVTLLEANDTVPKQVMYLHGSEWKSISSGIIYVMNDNGKTVAHYDLVPRNERALSSPAAA